MALLSMEDSAFIVHSSLEKIRRIPQAQGSTAICKVFADEFMKDLKERYGIPYSHTIMPIGSRNTDKWLLGVAAIMGKTEEAKAFIERERSLPAPGGGTAPPL
jgi:nitrogenase molybdenum-iron protein alpha chain